MFTKVVCTIWIIMQTSWFHAKFNTAAGANPSSTNVRSSSSSKGFAACRLRKNGCHSCTRFSLTNPYTADTFSAHLNVPWRMTSSGSLILSSVYLYLAKVMAWYVISEHKPRLKCWVLMPLEIIIIAVAGFNHTFIYRTALNREPN